MGKYLELKERHQREFDEFPKMFAFSKEQFAEGRKKLRVSSDKHLIGIGFGGFIRDTDRRAYLDLVSRHAKEKKEALQDEEYCYEMFYHELNNHEYTYTGDDEETIRACGLNVHTISSNPILSRALERAKADCMERCEMCAQ